MIRSTRTVPSLLLAATIGFSLIGTSPASAASNEDGSSNNSPGECQAPTGNTGFDSFLPNVKAGGFKSDMGGNVFITSPGSGGAGGRNSWDELFEHLGYEIGKDVVDDFNDTQDKAERDFDRKGKGDISSTKDNKHFKTMQVKNGFAVRSTNAGGVVGVYESEEKANAVANALEEEMEKQTEEHGSNGEPCILIFDPRSELP